MKIKTIELTGAALDWAVAKCEGYTDYDPETEKMLPPRKEYGWVQLCDLNYSTDWTQGGPIIERGEIGVQRFFDLRHGGWHWRAEKWNRARMADDLAYGPTPLIAAMRCLVASKLGDEVDVPEELT